ncbi:MAG: hypothetical protein HND52_16615 [Ignavibacteriae bacterium]|nr:hypothetical protein [Ignavibacteriota bacterium]NOG99582.1 hypothetical protein [Ignavibacteriota bacterium]
MKKYYAYFSVITFTIIYSVLRYNIFNDVPWQDLPLYVLNKAVSLSIIFLIFINQFYLSKNKSLTDFRTIITSLLIMHILFSLILLSPEFYSKFFNGNKLNLIGSLSMLFGAAAISALYYYDIKNFLTVTHNSIIDKLNIEKTKIAGLIFVSLHLFAMGIKGWLTPLSWAGFLPPISLIAFIFVLIIIFMKVKILVK